MRLPSFLALLLLPPAALAQQEPSVTRICLAPSAVESGSSNANAAMEATRENFLSYLTGPSLKAEPLTSRLESQAREEAKLATCPFLLVTTVKLVSKKGGSNLLGQVAAGAVREGAYAAGVATGSTAGRIAGSAVSAAAHQAAYNYAVTIRNKDELTLGYRLEAADGSVLLDKREKRSAKSDGEDVLTPLIQGAAEQIVAVAKKQPR
jgi:hypothetical protein